MKSIRDFVDAAVAESLSLKRSFFQDNIEQIAAVAALLREARSNNRKLLLFGNGGSAADAQHFAAELMHRVEHRPIGLRAIALTTDTSLLTALGNDEGFAAIFARQLEVLAERKDIAIAISTSGNSTNIVKALETARRKECISVGLLGRNGGTAKELCDVSLVVPHQSTPRIQEVHVMILHLLSQILESEL